MTTAVWGDRPTITPEQARENRIAVLRGVLKHQGDTKFYRKLLAGGTSYGAVLQALGAGGAVTHEEVLRSMGINPDAIDVPAHEVTESTPEEVFF